MNVVSAVVVLVFAVVGVAAVFREIALRLFALREDCTVMYLTNIRPGEENLEFVLRSALAKRRWSIDRHAVCAICINRELSDSERKICERICREYGFNQLMTKDEFLKALD